MPSKHSIILFMVSALALNLSPGPSILYILSRSIGQGREAGLVSVLGLGTATLIHAMAAAFGLSTLFVYSPVAFAVVKYLGAAYLIYLGVSVLLSRGTFHAAAAANATPPSLGAVYRQGVVTDLLNPKVALFFISFLPQFVDPFAGLADPVLWTALPRYRRPGQPGGGARRRTPCHAPDTPTALDSNSALDLRHRPRGPRLAPRAERAALEWCGRVAGATILQWLPA
jgi:threonine/homoserine/homoserine lactone efflux protein